MFSKTDKLEKINENLNQMEELLYKELRNIGKEIIKLRIRSDYESEDVYPVIYDIKNRVDKILNQCKNLGIIESQQNTIEQLTKALCNKYDRGLFIFSDDGQIPMVIRNGKELINDLTSYFSIEWNPGEEPNIHIDQLAATHHDMKEKIK